MNSSLVLGIEVPPVPAPTVGDEPPGRAASQGSDAGLESWWRLARAGVEAGATTVWIGSGPPATELAVAAEWCDPCTLAAGLGAKLEHVGLGVVSAVPGGRHPAVLAREVTTLDVLCGGRAALQLCWDAPAPIDVTVACEHLTDAVAVCAAMLRGSDPAYDGRYFHVSGAVNRPPPRQAGGPPVVVAPPPEVVVELGAGRSAGREAARQTGRRERILALARRLTAQADAVLVSAEPRVVAAWRAVLDEPLRGPRDANGPGLLGVVELAGTGGPREVAHFAAARDAGADGVVVRVPPATVKRDGGQPHAMDPDEVRVLAAEVYRLWGDVPA